MSPDARTLLLPLEPGSVRRAREWLAAVGGSLARETLEDAQLVLSELVSNAVEHAGGWSRRGLVCVHALLTPERLRVEVSDPGPGFSPPESVGLPPDGRPGGRGLFVVDRVADRWGVASDGRSRAWFEVERRMPGELTWRDRLPCGAGRRPAPSTP